MSGDTRMTRSTFDAIREHQQIEKYEALNTYNIYLCDRDAVGYDNGVSQHNSFRFNFPDNQSSHIKNAKIRCKSIMVGDVGNDIAAQSVFKLNTNICKNSFRSFNTTQTIDAVVSSQQSIGRFGGSLGVFHIKNSFLATSRTNIIPEIASAIGTNGAAPANSVFSNVSQNLHNILTTQLTDKDNPVACPINDGFYPCDNPFGKEVSFEIVDCYDGPFDLGNGAGEFTALEIEVILIPDNQSNDKFSY